jgi:flagellar motor switch protein FliN/FliY
MAKASATAEKTQPKEVSNEETSQAGSGREVSAQQVEYTEVASDQLEGADSTGSVRKLDIILDMNVPVTVVIGQAQIPVRRLLQLGPGSVLKLDKAVDAPAELFLKDSKFAMADVVVVDGKFAVRIKQIIGAGNAETAEKQKSADK